MIARPLTGAAGAACCALLLIGCGASPRHDDRPPQRSATVDAPEPDRFTGAYDVRGHSLSLECIGRGAPTMVLEVGEARQRGDLVRIQSAYDTRMRVCTYDRANKGSSGAAPTPREGDDLTSDLHLLLRTAGVPGPYLLVGHSAGGLIVQAYAATYPTEVAGLVAINPVAPWGPWRSVMRTMTPSERRGEVAFLTGSNGESLDYRDISRSVQGHVPADVPASFVISSAAQCPPGDSRCRQIQPAYEAVMRQVAGSWGQAPLEVVDASHDIQYDDLEAVTAAIDDVLARAEVP